MDKPTTPGHYWLKLSGDKRWRTCEVIGWLGEELSVLVQGYDWDWGMDSERLDGAEWGPRIDPPGDGA